MLVRPFIQPIKAFDVTTTNGVATVSVLGGDIIQTINYEIYNGSGQTANGSIYVDDFGGDEVRNFNIVLTSSMGIENNNSYTIRVYTSRTDNGVTTNSGYSSVQYFSCYVTPTITIKDSSNTTLGSGYEFTSQSGTLSVSFDAGSSSSPALLNDIEINIFGINSGTRDLVYSSGETYTPFVIEFDNLTPTTANNPIYTSYTLEWTAHTVQNMLLFGSFLSLTCDYTITENTGLISVENDCANGRIKVSFQSNSFSDIFELMGSQVSSNDRYIIALAEDETKVYALSSGLSSDAKFFVFDKATKSFSELSIAGARYASSLALDDTYVYIGANKTLYAYNKSTSSISTLATNLFINIINAICTTNEDSYVYIGGNDTTNDFVLYNKSSGATTSMTSPSGGIGTMAEDGDFVYLGGKQGSYTFAKYNKSSGAFTTVIDNVVGAISVQFADSTYLYGSRQGTFFVYDKEQNLFSSFQTLSTSINGCVSNDRFAYFGCSRQIGIYDKSNGTLSYSLPYSETSNMGNVRSLSIDENNLYVGTSKGYFILLDIRPFEIKRKEITGESSEFVTLINSSALGISGTISFYDYYTKTNAIYEYQITKGTQVESVQVLSQFGGAYIADGEQAFEIDAEWERSSFSQVQQSAIYEPYGAKYPVIAYNAVTNYRKGTDSCIVFNKPYSYNRSNDYIDRINQTKKQKAVNAFLTNRKAKVIKDFNGDIVLVCVVDVVGNSFVKELGNTLATTQFNWVEVGDFDDDTFRKLGITNSFKLYKN